MMLSIRTAGLAVALLVATPLLAQAAAMTPGAPMQPYGMRGDGDYGAMPLAGMSESGRRAVLDAMLKRSDADRTDRDKVRAARDRMLAVLGAERLDASALKRAMDDERDAANTMKARRQAGVLAAFQGLSVTDRKAFVADASSMRGRVERRIKRWNRGQRRGAAAERPAPVM